MNYKELGIELPAQISIDEMANSKEPRDSVQWEQARNSGLLQSFAFNNDWNTLIEVLGLARDLEDQALLHASQRKPEEMAEDQLKNQYKSLLDKLPPFKDRYDSHNFTTSANRKDFSAAGVNVDLLKVLFHDGLERRFAQTNQQGRFDLTIKPDSLQVKNHYSTVSLVLNFSPQLSPLGEGNFGVGATQYPFKDISNSESSRVKQDEKHMELAKKNLVGLGLGWSSSEERPSLYTIGAKYQIASSLIRVTNGMVDSYLASLTPYTQPKTA